MLHLCTKPAAPLRLHRVGLLALLFSLSSLSACGSLDKLGDSVASVGGWITPYKIDIVQGNVITSEQVADLRPGLTRVEVRNILGTPLLQSVFHADRWDYVFRFTRPGQPEQQRRLTVFFKDNKADKIEADPMPSEAEFVASLDVRRRDNKAPPLEATEAQLQAFKERNAQATPTQADTPAAAVPAAPAASYPPLESPRSANR